jgi:hypothetical protein
MKTQAARIILPCLLALYGALAAAPAKAGTYRPAVRAACAPSFLRTCVVDRRSECHWALDACGRRYAYEVVVTTYADLYSDGSRRLYTRVARA